MCDNPELYMEPNGFSMLIDDNDRSNYVKCVASNHIESVKSYLDAGMPVDIRHSGGYTALHFAAKKGLVGMVKLLLRYGADVNATERDMKTPLHIAIDEGRFEETNLDIVNVLLRVGSDLALKDRHGDTALMCAEKLGLADVIELIKQHEEQKCLDRAIGDADNGCGFIF